MMYLLRSIPIRLEVRFGGYTGSGIRGQSAQGSISRPFWCTVPPKLNFTVLCALEPAPYLHWLLHGCEDTPSLTELQWSYIKVTVGTSKVPDLQDLCARIVEAVLTGHVAANMDGSRVQTTHPACHHTSSQNPSYSGIVRHDSSLRESGVTRPGSEPGSHWWEASSLTAQPPSLHGVRRLLEKAGLIIASHCDRRQPMHS
ncbi:hypothetical protein PR048_025763 [Dryococelus australis]|uniref:Uncharacterized protein n=1 Tax=Dryococelus australis TaxID=614101 RepID=A0ABQ9GJH1_9NEOP|nr:hypothetical protein PR048_025763 [Dryococelus australis]